MADLALEKSDAVSNLSLMSDRVIAIGDIHGCLDSLNAVLDAIAPTKSDTIVTLGDYVDRGPDSKGVIDRLISLSQDCTLVPLIGNHEEMMLEVVNDVSEPYHWLQFGGVDTLDSYGFSGSMSVIPDSHRQFFDQLLDYFETESHFFVHANYEADQELAEQSIEYLRWIKLTDEMPAPHINGKRAVVGHTHDHAGEIFEAPHLVCLDTYCYGGRWLTAMDTSSGQLWQSDPEGNLRQKS
jgi:serine/threonine protein phosphatase 1